MSAKRKSDGVAPRHREALPRVKHPLRLEMRLDIYDKLLRLAKDDSAVATVERLILKAPEALPAHAK